jgi:hypothetical protein
MLNGVTFVETTVEVMIKNIEKAAVLYLLFHFTFGKCSNPYQSA